MTNYLTFITFNMDADSLWETFAQVLPRSHNFDEKSNEIFGRDEQDTGHELVRVVESEGQSRCNKYHN